MKKLLSFLFGLLVCTLSYAQVGEPSSISAHLDNDYFAVYPEFTSDGRGQVVMVTSDGKEKPYAYKVYDEDLNLLLSKSSYFEIEEIPIYNVNVPGAIDEASLVLSQTLFNDDSKYEYVFCKRKYNSNGCEIIYEFDILNEDNEILQSVSVPESKNMDEIELLLINDKRYLMLNNDAETLAYPIVKSGTGIKSVSTPVLIDGALSCRMKSNSLSITTSKTCSKDRDVTVFDASGRIQAMTLIPAGSTTATIEALNLNPGISVVSMKEDSGTVESCKVIVK